MVAAAQKTSRLQLSHISHRSRLRPARVTASIAHRRFHSSHLQHVGTKPVIVSPRPQPLFHRPFTAMASATTFYDFKPLDKKGEEVPLSDFQGKVVLVVNTASKCGFTPQYAGLEKLYKSVREKHGEDFVILGFPCNQFGGQEPGSNEEIQEFCQLNYGVSFPIMGKVDVNGDEASPLFQWLKEKQPGLLGLKRVKWNFEKFLIGKDGNVKGRWASITKPESLEPTILEELAK